MVYEDFRRVSRPSISYFEKIFFHYWYLHLEYIGSKSVWKHHTIGKYLCENAAQKGLLVQNVADSRRLIVHSLLLF